MKYKNDKVVNDLIAGRKWRYAEGLPKIDDYKMYELPEYSSIMDNKDIKRTGRRAHKFVNNELGQWSECTSVKCAP